MAVGLGLVFWMFLLFSPLAWVGKVRADDAESYGTVIGIVSSFKSSVCMSQYLHHSSVAGSLWRQHSITNISC